MPPIAQELTQLHRSLTWLIVKTFPMRDVDTSRFHDVIIDVLNDDSISNLFTILSYIINHISASVPGYLIDV